MPLPSDKLVKGNAYSDGAPRNGWFVASFIDESLGLKCRRGRQILAGNNDDHSADFELKMRRHSSGEKEEKLFPFNKTATTFSMMIGSGRFELFFCCGDESERVTLKSDGDYAMWAPNVGHVWIVSEASTIFTVRLPGRGSHDQDQTPLDEIPSELKKHFDFLDLQRRECRRIEGR